MDKSIKSKVLTEKSLLSALSSRKHYDMYIAYVDIKRLLPETALILDCYGDYYKTYPESTYIDWDEFTLQFKTNWHAKDLADNMVDWYVEAINSISQLKEDNVSTALLGLINREFVDKVGELSSSKINPEKAAELLSQYEIKYAAVMQDYDADLFNSDSADFSIIDKSKGIKYPYAPLNDSLGGMVSGSLVVLNAAHGIGKTACACDFAAEAIKQSQNENLGPVLFFNTEGSLNTAFARVLSNLFRDKIKNGYKSIINNPEKVLKHYKKTYGERLLLFKGNKKGLGYITSKVRKYKPSLIILDMAVAIMRPVSKNSSDTSNLEEYFNQLRSLSEEVPIVATVQAGVGAKFYCTKTQRHIYKMWPTDDDIYGSRTAVQSAAETIITIGRDNDNEYKRYIQTTKIKDDCPKTKFTCELEEKYSHYELKYIYPSYFGS
jgi:hypothetical protein